MRLSLRGYQYTGYSTGSADVGSPGSQAKLPPPQSSAKKMNRRSCFCGSDMSAPNSSTMLSCIHRVQLMTLYCWSFLFG